MAVRVCRANRSRGGERERGVDLRGGHGQQCPFLAVSCFPGVAVGKSQQAFGLGIVFRTRHRSSR